MSGEAMTQFVRRKAATEAGATAVGAEDFPDADAGEFGAAAVEKEKRDSRALGAAGAQEARAGGAEVGLDGGDSFAAYGNEALFIALSDAADTSHLQLEVADAEADQLGDAQS